ncbi:MAG: Gfo/Idh/MocA family oxidoreductase [Candidatus Aminicenantes bacterium]|nr:Gfo/Idh/MocA family oxidoreductase [Candidatus Aminicenantes bacterium]
MKIAVIGAGSMGKNHIRVLRNIPCVDEIVVSDINPETQTAAVNRFALRKTYAHHLEMLEKEEPDGVIVATPPHSHKGIVLDIIAAGIPVLVEKPIAGNIKDAEEMIAAADRSGVLLTVGHIERFNPVVTKIKEFIDDGFIDNIYLVNTHRIGPFPKRLLGNVEGVLIDLAVHDFDIINYLVGKIQSIQSQIIRSGKQEIYVKTLMDLETDIKASSEFSWISPRMVRCIEIYCEKGMFYGDYFNQEVWFYENDDYDNITDNVEPFFCGGLVKSGKVIKYPIYKQEPLLLELFNFIEAIKGKEDILVKPREALISLGNSLQI